jgi:branched-subunit amino acid aminotransferase/4-amino-4-deoxychorismate lyase
LVRAVITTERGSDGQNFSGEHLTELIKKLVALDKDWVPSEKGHSLYIRPTMIGTQAGLGVGPSEEIMLFVILSPVGPYYRTGFKPVKLLASTKDVRAWPGGTGNHKLGANYAGGVVPAIKAAEQGYQQILWLFGPERELTEVGTMNVFVVFERENGGEYMTLYWEYFLAQRSCGRDRARHSGAGRHHTSRRDPRLDPRARPVRRT